MTGLYWDEDGDQEGLLTRRSPEHCLTGQEIEDFLMNRLSGVSREAVEEHLLLCESCLKRVEEEERYIDALRGAAERIEVETLLREEPSGPPPAGSTRRSNAPWWAVAAGVAALLLGGSVAVRVLRSPAWIDVPLRVERSAAAQAVALPAAGQALQLLPDLRGLPPLPAFRWTVVNREGVVVMEGMVEPQGEAAAIQLNRGLGEGRYWVRVIDPETGVLLREYDLEIGRKR